MTLPVPTLTIGGPGGSEVSCAVLSAKLHHGRDDATSQPVASTAVIELVGELPAEAVIGARVAVLASGVPRFAGEVTDLGVGWDDPDTPRPSIIATGDLGRIGRRLVGSEPWPSELDGARAARVLTLAGFPPDPLLSDPGLFTVLGRDVDRRTALELAHETASDGGGLVWSDREGRILYADAAHRRGSTVALELNACDVGLGLEWTQSLEGLVNTVHVRYGPEVDGGAQAEVSAVHLDSVAAFETFEASLSTQLADAAAAQYRADGIIGRQAVPSWVVGGVELELWTLDAPTTAAVLGLEVHDLVSLTGLPAGSPATSALLWLEGWRETIEPGSHLLELAVSDYCRTSAPGRWDDQPAALTWDTMDPSATWDTSWCIPPPPSHGRWNDVAASLRWDSVDPATTWDSWS